MTDYALDILAHYRAHRNEEKAPQMAAYMKNRFEFLGLQKTERAELSKAFIKEKCNDKTIDWDFVDTLWDQPEREFQYLALNYLDKMKIYLKKCDTDHIITLIITKSWWDTVDGIAPLMGYLNRKYPEIKTEVIAGWINDPNMWLKRVSIIFQLKYRQDTDTGFLKNAILQNAGTKEFFINKAIGWALREYSKTDRKWVKQFIVAHILHPLSVREGSKYV